MEPTQPRQLLDQVRDALWVKHYTYRTEETYSARMKAVQNRLTTLCGSSSCSNPLPRNSGGWCGKVTLTDRIEFRSFQL
jgi:hypothetical protein